MHKHDLIWIEDPENGHVWEICLCGYCVDVTLIRGSNA